MGVRSPCTVGWMRGISGTQQIQDFSTTFYNGFEMGLYLKYVFPRSLKRVIKRFFVNRFINVLYFGYLYLP